MREPSRSGPGVQARARAYVQIDIGVGRRPNPIFTPAASPKGLGSSRAHPPAPTMATSHVEALSCGGRRGWRAGLSFRAADALATPRRRRRYGHRAPMPCGALCSHPASPIPLRAARFVRPRRLPGRRAFSTPPTHGGRRYPGDRFAAVGPAQLPRARRPTPAVMPDVHRISVRTGIQRLFRVCSALARHS